MRSALYAGNSTIVVEDRPPVPPAASEVQSEVAYTGICGTDLHILHGTMDHRVRVPQTIGHEMSGRVAALGPDVTGPAVGTPVTVIPLRWCGACAACRAGHSRICHRLSFVGIDSTGAMQQRWNVPAIGLLSAGKVAAETLITNVEPLTTAAAAFAALRDGGSVMKVLVDCRETTS